MSDKPITLTDVVRRLFVERDKFKELSDEDKQKNGFMINRMLGRKYPEYAQKLNIRSGDFIMIINLWWIFLAYQPKNFNPWVWPLKDGSNKSTVDKNTIELIRKRFPHLTIQDIEYLKKWYEEDFEEEVEYYKKLEEDYAS